MDSLTLFVVKDMDAAWDYVFKFELYNPPNAQQAQVPAIEASYVGNSRDIFVDGKGIERRTMTYPPHSDETKYPLKVLEAVFSSISVTNSSIIPCDNNTITISFRLNVNMHTRCKPILTFEGFTKAWTHTSHQNISSVGSMSTYTFIQLGGADAHRFVPVAVDDLDIEQDAQGVLNRYTQDIHAKVPLAPAVSSGNVVDYDLDARAGNVSYSGYGSWSNTDKKLKLYAIANLVPDTDYTFSFVVINPAQGQAASNISVTSVGFPISKIKAGVAMHTLNTMFDVLDIGQSSPFPCDENTITLTLKTNLPVFSTCAPTLTISNLVGTITRDTSQMSLSFNSSADLRSPEISGASTATGVWTQASGRLIVNVSSVIAAANRSSAQDFSFHFTVVNQPTGRSSPSITLTHNVANINREGAQASRTLAQVMNRDNTAGTVVFSAAEVVSPIVVQAGDAMPLFIRQASFYTRLIRQSSPYPCDDNNIITVSLRSNVPLLTTYCNHTVTISGLGSDFETPDNNMMDLNEAGHGQGTVIFSADSVWTPPNTYRSDGYGTIRSDLGDISEVNCTNGTWYNATSNSTVNCTNMTTITDPGYTTSYEHR